MNNDQSQRVCGACFGRAERSKRRTVELSLSELEQAYVASLQAAKASGHVGRHNRLVRRCNEIAQELKARGEARSVLGRLADHPDEDVRAWARGNLAWLDKPNPPSEAPREKGKFWPNIIWQCQHAPPAALSRNEIAKRLRRSLPEFCDRLMELALPAIGLCRSGAPTAG